MMENKTDTRSPEAAVLGSLILDPPQIEATKGNLSTEMFSHADNQIIFRAICEHANQGLDIVILKDYLQGRGELSEVGGVQYLVEVVESVPSAANLEYYANIVVEQHNTRQIQDHAKTILEISNDPELKSKEKLESIEIDFRDRLSGNRNQQEQNSGDKLTELLEDTIAGRRTSISFPWVTTSALTNSLLPGATVLLCGSPGASKSFMLLQGLCYWLKNGVPCCCYELEESVEYHLTRALAQLSGQSGLTDPAWIRNNPEQTRQAYTTHHDAIKSLGAVITAQPDQQVTLEQVGFWVNQQARQGKRIIAVDPVTIAAHTRRETWAEDAHFLEQVKRTATDHKCSIVLVTHPTKQNTGPGLESLAGGAAYARFCQTALWLQNHEMKESEIRTACGRITHEHNRTLHLLKSRNGSGQGAKLAYMFDVGSLTLQEVGLIIPKGK